MKYYLAAGGALAAVFVAANAYAADPLPMAPMVYPEMADEEMAGGPAFSLSTTLGYDAGDWTLGTVLEAEATTAGGLDLDFTVFGDVTFVSPLATDVGFSASVSKGFGMTTLGFYTSLTWYFPGADREFVLGATADFALSFVDLGFDLSRTWYNGSTSAIDLAISAGFAIGEAVTVTPGVSFEWTGGPPAIGVSLDVDVAVNDALTITPGLTMDVPGGFSTLGLSLDAEYAVRPNLSLSAGVSYAIGGGLGASVGFTIGFGG